MKTVLFTTIALTACSGGIDRQHATFSRLAFDMPGDWSHSDSIRRGVSTQIWTPADNEHHESVTVIRTELAPAMAKAGSPTLDNMVAAAIAGLPGAKSPIVSPFLTRSGLRGVRAEVDYVPPGARASYHRVHVVLSDHDGRSLVHVLYTARIPDEDAHALDLVLTTIHEGEG